MTAKGKALGNIDKSKTKCIKERIFGFNKRQNSSFEASKTKTQNMSGYVFLITKLSVNLNTKHWRDTRLITR